MKAKKEEGREKSKSDEEEGNKTILAELSLSFCNAFDKEHTRAQPPLAISRNQITPTSLFFE